MWVITQLHPTLCNPTDCSPTGSSVPGILQARILEWVAISFSMDVRVGLQRKLSAEELMPLNCGAGEDSWEPLGLQGDPTSPSWRRPVLGVHWKDWCWSSNTLVTWCEELTHLKRPWCWERLRAGRGGDEMVVWHPWFNGHEFEQAPGNVEEQGSLACCSLCCLK